MNSLYAEKSVGYGASGIARSSHQHVDVGLPLFFDEISQQTGHKATSHVFERECRAVEKFKAVDVFFYFDNRGFEIERIVNDFASAYRPRYLRQKNASANAIGNFLKRQLVYRFEKFGRQSLDTFRHVKPFIGSQSFTTASCNEAIGDWWLVL